MEASSSPSASTSTPAAVAPQARELAQVAPPASTTSIQTSPSSHQYQQTSPARSRTRSPPFGHPQMTPSYGRAVDADTRGETSASGARRAMAETYRPLGSEDYRNRPATAPKSGLIGSIALSVSSSSGPGHRDLPGGQADGPPPTSSLATGRLSPIPRTNAYDSPKPDPTPSPHTIQTSSNSRPTRLSSDMDVDPDPSVAVDVKVASQPPRSSSSLSPLPAMYALASSSQRSIDPDAQGEEDDDDDDEVISSSEKGEGDAALLQPINGLSPNGSPPAGFSAVVPSAVDLDDDPLLLTQDVAMASPSAPPSKRTVGSSPLEAGSSTKTGASASSRSTGAGSSSALRPATEGKNAGKGRSGLVSARASRNVDSDSDASSEVASVASQLSDSDDELETMDRQVRPKGVLTDKNTTSRPPPPATKPHVKLTAPVSTHPAGGRTPRSTNTYVPGKYKLALSLTADDGPGSLIAQTEAARFKSLIKATDRRQQALAKNDIYNSSAKFALSDESDMSDDSEDASSRKRRKGKQRATYPTPSTDRVSSRSSSSSGSSSSSSDEHSADERRVPVPSTELLGEETAMQLEELMGNDRADKRAQKKARRAHKTKGLGGWTGCWAWGTGRIKAAKVKMIDGDWDRLRLEGQSKHPSFALLKKAVALQDDRQFSVLLSCGILDTCLPSVTERDKLLVSLVETAAITSNANLSRLSAQAAVDLLAASDPEAPVIDPSTLVRLLISIFKQIGIRVDLFASLDAASPDDVAVEPVQRAPEGVYPMGEVARERAIGVLVQVLDAASEIGLLPCSAAQLFVPLLAVIALERDISFALGRSIQSALAALINMAETNEDEVALCETLVVFISPYKMTFKYAFLAILPQAGPIASRLVMGCALDVLGISPEESSYGAVQTVDDVADLLNQDPYRRPRSPLFIDSETEYDQLSAGVHVFALVLHDLHRIYLLERRRIDDAQAEADEDERMERTEVDKLEMLRPIEEAIETADRKILDSRGSDLARTSAKALFLNLLMSVGFRERQYKALYLRDREGAMMLLD